MCERIVELAVGQESIVVGTLYKEMSKKPCLLDEINVLEASASAGGGGQVSRFFSVDLASGVMQV